MFKTCVGCDVTQALKKDVHASADEHIRRPATAPHVPMNVWLCVHAWTPVCLSDGGKRWCGQSPGLWLQGRRLWGERRRKSSIKCRLLQKPDSWDKPDTVKGKRKSKPMGKLNESHQRCEGWGRHLCLSAWVVHNRVNLRHLDTYFGWEELNNLWPFHNLHF